MNVPESRLFKENIIQKHFQQKKKVAKQYFLMQMTVEDKSSFSCVFYPPARSQVAAKKKTKIATHVYKMNHRGKRFQICIVSTRKILI